MMEHKILVATSRNASDLPDVAAAELDACAAEGWEVVTAYGIESSLYATTAHHFVMRRPKQPTTPE